MINLIIKIGIIIFWYAVLSKYNVLHISFEPLNIQFSIENFVIMFNEWFTIGFQYVSNIVVGSK